MPQPYIVLKYHASHAENFYLLLRGAGQEKARGSIVPNESEFTNMFDVCPDLMVMVLMPMVKTNKRVLSRFLDLFLWMWVYLV